MKLPSLYFGWLQKGNPTGQVDHFPELRGAFETSVAGMYCSGDLTGIPLIKLAAESGYDLIETLVTDDTFRRQREANTDKKLLDLVIVGAGPSGISASLRAAEHGLRHVVLESSQIFNTIKNFPAGKPIFVTPEGPMKSQLKFSDGTKETLLEELAADIEGKPLPVNEGEMVQQISREDTHFAIKTTKQTYKSLRVIVAIGKTGNARTLGVPGEDLPKVFTRLIDPGEHHDQDILVVGGGDSAVEAAVALAGTGNRVTLSYRKPALSRPKEHNLRAFDDLVAQGRITPLFESTVKQVRRDDVVLNTTDGEKTLPNQAVYALIGSELPTQFFKRAGIRMEGEKRFADWMQCVALVLFAAVLYFGKKAPTTTITSVKGFFQLPARFIGLPWHEAASALLAWVSLVALSACGAYLLVHMIRNRTRYFTDRWNTFKYGYYWFTAALFCWLYITCKLRGQYPWPGDMGSWYTLMYTLTIVVFGLRRMHVTPTGYIKRQTWTLMAFQVIPLCILPMFVLPWMGRHGLLGDWVMQNMFPGGSYWRAYGFILAWPLFIHNLATNQPTAFWLIVGVLQSFAIIPYLNYRWGKGAYCGWICSCGALAETLGDEYRTRAPHGPTAKKMDNAGQVVLWFALGVTILALVSGSGPGPLATQARRIYDVVVDVVFAGVLGVGVYFFMSGRVWCRFLCPLAALMHIYTRLSPYRIMSNKKRCISCNICTKVCHMGIDVMGFANKGIPMNDVECVRCSACIVNCPMNVLTFGVVDRMDLDNVRYKDGYIPLARDWTSGLPQDALNQLLQEEQDKHPEAVAGDRGER